MDFTQEFIDVLNQSVREFFTDKKNEEVYQEWLRRKYEETR